MTKTRINTVLEFADGIRATVVNNDGRFVRLRWEGDGAETNYPAHRIECNKDWQIAED